MCFLMILSKFFIINIIILMAVVNKSIEDKDKILENLKTLNTELWSKTHKLEFILLGQQ